ncbi:General secretion pathway protein K [gamma proteobacterium HdN1]|nr:General secretion pathway protein K [gamma proteobacterium HdN1]
MPLPSRQLPGKSLAKQQGTVLVTVLMMFAIAAFMAAEMGYRQKYDVRRTSAMLMTEQAREYLTGAEQVAKLALIEDFKSDRKNNAYVDSLNEIWATRQPPFPVDGGYIQGQLIDAQSLFNINNLILPDTGKPSPTAKTIFINIMNGLDIPKEGSAEAVYEKIVDWLDTDQNETGTDGREDSYYMGLKRPYRTGGQPLADLSELRAIDGIDRDTFEKLAPHIVALPPGTPINLNTAESELLSAAQVKNIDQLLSRRNKNPVKANEVAQYLPKSAPTGDTTEGSDSEDTGDTNTQRNASSVGTAVKDSGFSANSEYFELRAAAKIGERTLYSRAIVYRKATQGASDDAASRANDGRLQVIYRAFVDPLQQPDPVVATPASE